MVQHAQNQCDFVRNLHSYGGCHWRTNCYVYA